MEDVLEFTYYVDADISFKLCTGAGCSTWYVSFETAVLCQMKIIVFDKALKCCVKARSKSYQKSRERHKV